MASPLLHVGASINCAHGAAATITSTNSRVKVGGKAVALVDDKTSVETCQFQVPIGTGTKPQPCKTVEWSQPASKVKVNGKKVLLKSSMGTCQTIDQIKQGPASIVSTQTKAKGT